MLRFTLVRCLLAAGVVASPALGATTSATEKRVNLEARGERLREVTARLSATAAVPITVEKDVPDATVRLMLRDVTLDHVLTVLIRQLSRECPRLQYEMTDAGFRIHVAPPAATPPPPPEPEMGDRVVVTSRPPGAGLRTGFGVPAGSGSGGYQPGPYLVRGGYGFSGMSISQGGRGANYRSSVTGAWGFGRYAFTSSQPVLGGSGALGVGRGAGEGGYSRRPF